MGAGTAGANVAGQLAGRGLSVVLVERRRMRDAGARWHNAVLDWQFERAGVAVPSGAERASHGATVHMFGPDGVRGATVHDAPTVRADMVALGDRLRGMARDAGAVLLEHAGSAEAFLRDGRVVAIELDAVSEAATTAAVPALGEAGERDGGGVRGGAGAGGRPRRLRLEAPLFVDAAGRSGALRSQVPGLASWCLPVRGNELCSAADHHHRVTDKSGAREFLDRHGARPGESVTIVGTDGGFSTRSISVGEDLEEVSVLVGCLANGRYGSAPRMLADLRGRESWIGEAHSGGAGVIPLRRTWARITAAGVALVGDSACQVFPAHGSGIGMGLIAGRMLADVVADADDPGDPDTLWAYQAGWHREFGGPLAAFDAFRRMSTALGTAGVRSMLRAGLLSEQMVRAGLDQRWLPPPPSELAPMAARLARNPTLAAAMAPMLARGRLAGRLGERYPRERDDGALRSWESRMSRILGPLPV